MKPVTSRRKFIGLTASALGWLLVPARAQHDDGDHGRGSGGFVLPPELAQFAGLSLVLGRITDRSVTVSALSKEAIEGYYEYGTASGHYTRRTASAVVAAGKPAECCLDNLLPNTAYYFRLQCRKPGELAFQAQTEGRFHTQRAAGSTFAFAIQGDSHPERPWMSDPALYARTLLNAAASVPDFYICMGDDFSVAPVHEVNFESIAERYTLQRPFLGLVARTAPIFLLNGNHEQASLFNYDQSDGRHDVAVHAQNARNQYYPMPAPGRFYGGDAELLPAVGLRRDYYAWTWGDALFVVLDNYWHSPSQVDSGFHEQNKGGGHDGHDGHDGHGGKGKRDLWAVTLGEAQYRWFKHTLEQSPAKYKFVFAHHVLGTGRGGVDECDLFEWGGHNKRGDWEFDRQRPGWELPVHQLMAKHGVTIFFQGHDHLFCRQERDGIVYQEVPMPADPGYVAYNDDRYLSGVKLPNSGHLRVTVSPEEVRVDYVRTYLPKDETAQARTGDIAHTYTVRPKSARA